MFPFFFRLLASVVFAQTVTATPILTEIHYNGPLPGTDPDEFIELSNPNGDIFSLNNYKFVDGVSLEFAVDSFIPAFSSLVLARDIDAFAQIFTDFSGTILEFEGALSNSGETLTLLDALGEEVWSIAYDDMGDWPRSADGLGNSLQRVSTTANGVDAWIAGPPTPGDWNGLHPISPKAVPTPSTLGLFMSTFLLLAMRNSAQKKANAKIVNTAHSQRQRVWADSCFPSGLFRDGARGETLATSCRRIKQRYVRLLYCSTAHL